MANTVDTDQMLHSVVPDLGLHCLQYSVPILRIITVVVVIVDRLYAPVGVGCPYLKFIN